ncbi:serine/threonine-protein phosphatase 6 regulatory ankyrin repeat subunit C-like [Schistocerca americana]|uniref:serine/threonine-protein phosphatase 6 regulatory ankyrin repeat subunit C-like n=4 Tax=Schistocerca TaxID=7008 RepID=UPI001F50252F|nr:serine/threonine-protein phosphatase 6 regulatory ankyrin repeat subunit C-like [Schistocerca americana]
METFTMAAAREVQEAAATDAGEGTTVTLVAGDTRLVADRAVLADRSPVFAAMLCQDTPEANSSVVTVPDVEGPVLHQLLAYMNSLHAPEMPRMAPQLLAAADRYGVWGLKVQCEEQLASQLSAENAARTAVLAVRYSCPSLAEVAVAFIKANSLVFATAGWADAVLNHPDEVVKVSQLLGGPLTETRSLPGKESSRGLIQAAKEGAVEQLRMLLARGAKVGVRDEDMWTALHWAAERGHLEAVTCLMEGGAEVDVGDSRQNTPLHWAAYRGHVAVTRRLLESSADPDARDKYGWTPLHCAARCGHTKVAAVLLDAGADTEARDAHGHEPWLIARQNGKQQLVEMLS